MIGGAEDAEERSRGAGGAEAGDTSERPVRAPVPTRSGPVIGAVRHTPAFSDRAAPPPPRRRGGGEAAASGGRHPPATSPLRDESQQETSRTMQLRRGRGLPHPRRLHPGEEAIGHERGDPRPRAPQPRQLPHVPPGLRRRLRALGGVAGALDGHRRARVGAGRVLVRDDGERARRSGRHEQANELGTKARESRAKLRAREPRRWHGRGRLHSRGQPGWLSGSVGQARAGRPKRPARDLRAMPRQGQSNPSAHKP